MTSAGMCPAGLTRAKWFFATDDEVWSSPALSSDDKTVFVGSNDYKFYAINTADGAIKWQPFATGGRVWSSPALSSDNKIVFFGCNEARIAELMAP